MYRATFVTKFHDPYLEEAISQFRDIVIFVEAAAFSSDGYLYMVVKLINLKSEQFRELLKKASKNLNIQDIEVLARDKESYYIFMRKRRCELLPLVLEHGCFLMTPYKIFSTPKGCKRIFTVVSPTISAIKELQKIFSSRGLLENLKIESISPGYHVSIVNLYEILLAIAELSPKQMKTLITAFEKGYFDWPRKMKSEEISRVLGFSKATFSQHLRRAEAKILKPIIDLIRNSEKVERNIA